MGMGIPFPCTSLRRRAGACPVPVNPRRRRPGAVEADVRTRVERPDVGDAAVPHRISAIETTLRCSCWYAVLKFYEYFSCSCYDFLLIGPFVGTAVTWHLTISTLITTTVCMYVCMYVEVFMFAQQLTA